MPPKMHVDTRPKFISFNLKTVSAAVISAVLFSNASAAGLGKLTVLSSLGQPLHAEIELTSVSKEESGSLTVRLAPTEAFRQANIEFNPALFALRFAVEQRGGRQFIRVTSTQPINEPFVDMLLEVGAANSRLVREYTFLLDPADLRKAQPAQIATPNASLPKAAQMAQPGVQAESRPQPSSPAEKPASPGNRPREASALRAAPAQQPVIAAKSAAQPEEYQVKKGDTLARIAGQVKPEGISLDQMLVALQRANPNAFIGNNINRLRAGQILSVPGADAARGVSNTEARGIVIAQAADFNSYQNKLAGRAATAAPQTADEGKQSATGKITTKVEEQPTAANESRDKLKLSKSGAVAAGADKGGNAAAEAEDRIAKEKALAEANARIRELEKNVSDLQKLLEIKNKDLAEKQIQANAAKTVSASAAPGPSAANAPQPPAATSGAPPVKAPAPVSTPDSAASAPAVPAPAPSTPLPAQSKPAATPAGQKTVATVAPAETGFIDDLLANPLLLLLAAVALAGLGALGIYGSRRKKQNKEFRDSNILTDSGLKTNSLFGSTGGQSVDTNNSVFNSNFAPSASQLDTNEVDPLAEADVYIAYGRDAQAEEILKEALRTQPERHAVRVKLLEIYASRKDLRAFEMMASELYSLTKGDGEEWQQAASLGIALDPKNPLYAGGKPTEAAAVKAAALTAATQPLDELDLDGLLNTTQTSHASLEGLNTIESGPSRFSNTAGAFAAPSFEPLSDQDKKEPAPVAAAPVPETPAGLDFDFDLAGLGIKEAALPPAPPPALPPEISTTPDAMDFDFLQESSPEDIEPQRPDTAAAPSSPDVAADDFAPVDTQLTNPLKSSRPAHEFAAAPSALDFDLSGINFDLNSVDSTTAPEQNELGTDGDAHSNTAEMATKLDLALAYQEIGDKEGARELLDEVVKGGTAEQTEKARSILQKIA